MSYQEIKSIVALVSSLAINGIYGGYIFLRYQQQNPDTGQLIGFWATAMLLLIGVALLAQIGVAIVFAIAYRLFSGESPPSRSDERDQVIGLRATRNAYYAFAVGLGLSMFTQVVGLPPVALFVGMFLAGIASDIVQAGSQFYYYRLGVQ